MKPETNLDYQNWLKAIFNYLLSVDERCFSQGQLPWYKVYTRKSFDQQMLLRVKLLYRTKRE